MTATAWGDPSKYYNSESFDEARHHRGREIATRWLPMLEEFEPDLESRVQVAVKDWGQSIRDQLRIETALRLSSGGQHVSVPVKVMDGIPPPLWDLINLPPEVLRLVFMRGLIAESAHGVGVVQRRFSDVELFMTSVAPDSRLAATKEDLGRVEHLLETLSRELEKVKLFEQIWREPVDWLGAYFFRRPAIEIYWIPIGIAAALCKVDVESVTYVVLAHELAHAYTHLGRDIDGHQWNTGDFARTNDYIVEGLAQHYTRALCENVLPRFPAAEGTFRAMLQKQTPGPYADFVSWTEGMQDPGEHMRRCMLEVRKRSIRDYGEFRELLGS